MILCLLFLLFVSVSKAEPLRRLEEPITENSNQTRRILRGRYAGDTRPYMVYLRQATPGPPPADMNWLCGGAIIHPRYVLTSAACIQDVSHFYVISGTKKWTPSHVKNNKCIVNGAKRAVAKYVPKNYIYDGRDFNNINWIANDIAVVKVDGEFNFRKRVKGCCYIPQMIAFNNQSEDLEKPKTEASIAGWGSREKFSEIGLSASANSHNLLETGVTLMSKRICKKRWPERYHFIIDGNMICGRDGANSDLSNSLCGKDDKKCRDAEYSYEDQTTKTPSIRRVFEDDPESLLVHSAAHMNGSRRFTFKSGGFCENDHGGPLIVGRGKHAVVVGVIAACLMRDINQKCHGPFLFTSVWQNRHLINCVINDETGGEACQNLFESRKIGVQQTQFDWTSIPAGPTKVEFSDEEIRVRAASVVTDDPELGDVITNNAEVTEAPLSVLELLKQDGPTPLTTTNYNFYPY